MADYSGRHDFDFLLGKWRVEHSRLAGRLTGATEWTTQPGIDWVRPAFVGLGNIGCFRRLLDNRPFEGRPIRLYSPVDATWRIYWLDTFDQRMEPAVVGGFADNVGEFIGPDRLRGKAILVRYRWTDIDTDKPRWEQAYSPDDGASWEVNSVMRFSRDEGLPDSLFEDPNFHLPTTDTKELA